VKVYLVNRDIRNHGGISQTLASRESLKYMEFGHCWPPEFSKCRQIY
jgi:hypothetical protein